MKMVENGLRRMKIPSHLAFRARLRPAGRPARQWGRGRGASDHGARGAPLQEGSEAPRGRLGAAAQLRRRDPGEAAPGGRGLKFGAFFPGASLRRLAPGTAFFVPSLPDGIIC